MEQPAAEGLALEAPQPEGQRCNHLQIVELHPVDDPLCRSPAQCLRAVDGPDVGPHGRLEDSEQAGDVTSLSLSRSLILYSITFGSLPFFLVVENV